MTFFRGNRRQRGFGTTLGLWVCLCIGFFLEGLYNAFAALLKAFR